MLLKSNQPARANHLQVTNDDGPPSNESSPYILAFVRTLEEAGHEVSVILPSEQRSWIGKAHIIGKDVRRSTLLPLFKAKH